MAGATPSLAQLGLHATSLTKAELHNPGVAPPPQSRQEPAPHDSLGNLS